MQQAQGRRIPVGRVRGHRGRGGEITVRVFSGDAEYWTELPRVWIGSEEQGSDHDVEASRGYRDRLVLKLVGVDDAREAELLRGKTVMAEAAVAPRPEPDTWRGALLIGMGVVDEAGSEIGIVKDFLITGAADLLVVTPPDGGEELLVPLVEPIVYEVDAERELVRIRPPEGLLELNRERERRR